MGFLELFPQMDETSPLAGQDASNGPKSYTDTTTQPLLPSSDFKLYKRRWAMLALFSIISMLSGALQFTTSAIQDELVAWYNVDNTRINLMTLILNVEIIGMSFFVAYITEARGLRWTLNIGAVILIVPCWLRWGAAWMTPERIYQFWILFGGQCMLGIALPFVGLNVVTVLATNWFSENERTIGGTIAMLANILGPAVAFGVCPAIVKTGTDIQTLLLAEAIAITVVSFLVIIAFRAKPPTPPSSAAVVEDKHDTAEKKLSFIGGVKIFFVDLFACFKELHFVILLVGYGLGFGAIQSLMTLINQISIPEGYDTDQAGLFGVALVVASIFGALIAGGILDKTRRYVMVLRIVLVGALGCAAWLTFDLRPNRFPVLMACCALLGFFAVALVPVCLEAAVEVTFPIPEASPTGLMTLLGTAFTVVNIAVMNRLQNPDPPFDMRNALYYNFATLGAAAILLAAFNGKYKRFEHEKSRSEQKKSINV